MSNQLPARNAEAAWRVEWMDITGAEFQQWRFQWYLVMCELTDEHPRDAGYWVNRIPVSSSAYIWPACVVWNRWSGRVIAEQRNAPPFWIRDQYQYLIPCIYPNFADVSDDVTFL
jgi:hypothetical protein